MDNQYRAIFSRNIGLFTKSEQDMLRRSTIAIAGAEALPEEEVTGEVGEQAGETGVVIK